MDSGILIGIFTLAGTLAGISLTHLYNRNEQKKARQAEYVRLAFTPLRASANNMELTARHIIFILVSLRMGASKSQKNLVNKSLKKIEEDLTTEPMLPEILDARIAKAWEEVSHKFGALLVTYNLESPSLLPTAFTQRPPRIEFLKKYQEIFNGNNFEALGKEIAPDEETKVIFDAASNLIASVIRLREEIRRLSTEGK
jgi:hypothetical protein